MDGKYNCNTCNKNYSCYKSLWNHNKKFHNNINTKLHKSNTIIHKNNTIIHKNDIIKCIFCDKKLSRSDSLKRHQNICKKKIENNKIEKLELEIKKIKEEMSKTTSANSNNNPINNQLVNLIVDKTNTIEELQTKIENIENNISNNLIENNISNNLIETNKIPTTLNLNNVVIVSRSKDNYINATQLCQAGNKKFNHWYSLDNTKQLINVLESKAGIPVLELIEINKGGAHLGSWIHPDLAIQLAQWISPIFSLQVSSWIRTLFTNGNVSIDIKILEDKNKEIKLKDHKIQLLQDAFVRKQQRTNYPEKNVIYMLTTEDNKKKRNYIIGKTTNLKKRLGNYNKSNEHEVIYYKECLNEEDMNIIELTVLNKLKEYKEKANRDRFILPTEKDISLFTNIIEKTIDIFYSY
jgi:hypothetical protein